MEKDVEKEIEEMAWAVRAAKDADAWWKNLTEDLLKQEEVEDYYYEFRREPQTATERRTLCHFYPAWWEGWKGRWQNVYLLCRKGYSLSYRPEREAAIDTSFLNNKKNGYAKYKEVMSAEEVWTGEFLSRMIFDMAYIPEAGREWFICQAENCRKELKAIGECVYRNFFRGLRERFFELQKKHGNSCWEKERRLDAVREWLPEYYRELVGNKGMWADICVENATRWTLGFPDFSFLERYWELQEIKREEKDGSKASENDETERIELWKTILEKSLEDWIPVVMQERGKTVIGPPVNVDSEYENLFERMFVFFRKYSREPELRKHYQYMIDMQLAKCRSMRSILAKLPEVPAGLPTPAMRLKMWEERLQKESEELEGMAK